MCYECSSYNTFHSTANLHKETMIGPHSPVFDAQRSTVYSSVERIKILFHTNLLWVSWQVIIDTGVSVNNPNYLQLFTYCKQFLSLINNGEEVALKEIIVMYCSVSEAINYNSRCEASWQYGNWVWKKSLHRLEVWQTHGLSIKTHCLVFR